METKTCSHCKKDLPLDEFNKKGSGKQPYCRACQSIAMRAYYALNRLHHRSVVMRLKAKRMAKNRDKLREYFSSRCCVDCGNKDIRVLEFDHVRGTKSANVSLLLARGHSWGNILAEIIKCDLVCANCHRIRTFERTENCYRNPVVAHMA
jgi:hypothetical protein